MPAACNPQKIVVDALKDLHAHNPFFRIDIPKDSHQIYSLLTTMHGINMHEQHCKKTLQIILRGMQVDPKEWYFALDNCNTFRSFHNEFDSKSTKVESSLNKFLDITKSAEGLGLLHLFRPSSVTSDFIATLPRVSELSAFAEKLASDINKVVTDPSEHISPTLGERIYIQAALTGHHLSFEDTKVKPSTLSHAESLLHLDKCFDFLYGRELIGVVPEEDPEPMLTLMQDPTTFIARTKYLLGNDSFDCVVSEVATQLKKPRDQLSKHIAKSQSLAWILLNIDTPVDAYVETTLLMDILDTSKPEHRLLNDIVTFSNPQYQRYLTRYNRVTKSSKAINPPPLVIDTPLF